MKRRDVVDRPLLVDARGLAAAIVVLAEDDHLTAVLGRDAAFAAVQVAQDAGVAAAVAILLGAERNADVVFVLE